MRSDSFKLHNQRGLLLLAPFVILAGLLTMTYAPVSAAPLLADESQGDLGRYPVICGPNAVYIFLLLSNVTPSVAYINSIDCGTEGVALLDLRRIVETFQISAEIRHFEPDELLRMPFPAVCQTTVQRNLKHFVVAHSATPEGLRIIDPTDGECYVLAPERFTYLTGYALVPKRSTWQWLRDDESLHFSFLLFLNLASLWSARRRGN